ncbi:MAG: PAS domain-containing protein [Proteobacteria bacterium]|nr:PAS domain-containing protein [Pseudomonadota bacterium]
MNRLNLKLTDFSSEQKEQLEGFLQLVNKSYLEADQERYLSERSMEISSRELLELNKNLETAQHMGHLGYWEADIVNDKIFWSKELYILHGLTPGEPPPKYDQFLKSVHEDDRAHIKSLIKIALAKEGTYKTELRIRVASGEYRWFHVMFQSFLKDGAHILRGISLDITERKKTEQEITSLHNQLILASRLAGMADVASSLLHNVGNVLNSATVSVDFLKEFIGQSKIKEVDAITLLLQENLSRLPEYIATDPQGKFVPEFIIVLLQKIKEEYTLISKEVDNLSKHITHVNDIIVSQNDISRASGMRENIFLPEAIDTALEMTDFAFEEHNIHIMKNYQKTPFVLTDKVKLLQILVNLIRNAKDALMENSVDAKKIITIFLKKDNLNNKLIIKVKDNGIGIAAENLQKIFTLGFTTKERGHGMGLHMSALNAKEMGGSLEVESGGIGKGATFNLIIPKVEVPPPLMTT